MTNHLENRRPVVLCILDGWGYNPDTEFNAIKTANTPTWDRFKKEAPNSFLKACSTDVGLPSGQMGNSEVGHMNLGAGRVVLQDLPRITHSIEKNEIQENSALLELISALKASGGRCHMISLISDGGVHSHMDHTIALVKILCEASIPVVLHGLMDGRDTPPTSGKSYLSILLESLCMYDNFSLATINGRYYAMDRDNRWERVSLAWDSIVNGSSQEKFTDPLALMETSYRNNITDEFIVPAVHEDYHGMQEGDALFMTSFRADRAREILRSIAIEGFTSFDRSRYVPLCYYAGMVEYSDDLNHYFTSLFPPYIPHNFLGEIVSKAGLRQLRIAETEKYPHVTFFFNGGHELPWENEKRILINSPKVATYDLQPEMSAPEVCDQLVQAIKSQEYDVIIANFANGDMVGHTGFFDAATAAAETIDSCLSSLEEAILHVNGTLLITSDHGNCEKMWNEETDEPYTAHTTNLVRCILVNPPSSVIGLKDGILADVAPTLLELLNMCPAKEMTGKTLLLKT